MIGLKNILNTDFIGKDIYYFKEIDSTNNKAYELAEKGAEEGIVIIAESQTRGKGRLGRRWESPYGVNLYTSIILRPQISPNIATLITIMSSIAVSDAINKSFNIVPQIKWPNDIIINNKKVSGILTEMDSNISLVNFIILGIGVNLNMDVPEYLKDKAISIKEIMNKEVSRVEFTAILFKMIEKWYNNFLKKGFESIIYPWNRYSMMEGKLIKVSSHGETIEGYSIGLDRDGALILRDRNGIIRRVIAGDVTVIQGDKYFSDFLKQENVIKQENVK